MKYIIIVLSILFFIEKVEGQELQTRDIATGLDTPWEILWGPDNHIWITERFGRISRLNPETSELQELILLNEVFEDGERGLMGMALHPDFINNPFVYTIYTYKTTNDATLIKLVRLIYDGEKLHSPKTIFDSIPGAWNHDGARLLIDDDLTIYISMGDAAVPNRSQQMNSLNGKILRMNLDGSIPADNPFPNSYIWSLGHRNPQGLVKYDGVLYSSEHGANTDDELNIIVKGRNYGWPNVEGFCDKPAEQTFCEQNQVVEPIATWTPTIAVAGIDFYNHNLLQEWNNSILAVALKSSVLVQNKLSEDRTKVVFQTKFFEYQFGRLRDLCISPDGRVYLATSNKDGRGSPKPQDDRIIEIKPKYVNVFEHSESNIYLEKGLNGFLKIRLANELLNVNVYDYLGNLVNPVSRDATNLYYYLPEGLFIIQEINNNISKIHKFINI